MRGMDLSQIVMLRKGIKLVGLPMTGTQDGTANAGSLKLAALLIGIALVGLPINGNAVYALLVVMAVLIFSGDMRVQGRAWLTVLAIVVVAVVGQALLTPPRIDEGHNVFLPASALLQRGLPADVYREAAQEFDAQYPPAKRCDPKEFGCWQGDGSPDRVFAFSADGIWHENDASRAVTTLDFSDAVWLRLGFVNENRYNWTNRTDVERGVRDRRFWMGMHRWHFTMPWFEMVRWPSAYVGGELCWRGSLLWEGDGERFTRQPEQGCRTIAPADAGRRVFGLAIKPDILAMSLTPPWPLRLMAWAQRVLLLAAAIGLIVTLVRVNLRRATLPFIFITLAVAVIAIDDGTFLGGLRPFDGGDDGLFYDGVGRIILQKLMAGDIWGALEGGEAIFYYGGPGLRYFRALEHIVFGESYLGYLSLILVLPILVWRLFRRFLPEPWPLTLTLIFIAVPVGTLFGTSFTHYVKWAGRGFADPLAYIFFIAGVGVLVRPNTKFAPALFGALLLVLGISMKPIVAPAAAVLLTGCGLASLAQRQWPRLTGLCLGTVPVFWMALHNWVFGHRFILFSSNAGNADLLVLPPAAYFAALRRAFAFDFGGLKAVALQLADWLSGPSELHWTIPLSAAGVIILVWVVLRGRQFDPWLRLIGTAALAQHVVAFFYNAAIGRYHFLTWFLTMLVVMVWLRDVGVGWLQRRYPLLCERFTSLPTTRWLASGLARLQKVAS
jgi:hypothetical protein